MYTQKSDAQSFYADTPRERLMPRGKIIIAICAVIVLAMTAGITVFSIEKMFSDKYEHAAQLMASNNFLKAKQEFLNFSGYKDSAARAQECQDNIDFGSAEALLQSGDYAAARKIFAALDDFGGAPEKVLECDYADAAALMSSGKPEEAMDKFLALGDYSDSEEQAKQCQKEIDYLAAAELMNQKDYENAMDAFKSLKDYKDSAEKAQECLDCLYNGPYTAATELLNKKDYAKALEAFNALGRYKDSVAKAQECQNNLDYIAADTAFNKKYFYTAYTGFKQLGSFSDSADRAKACVQKKPGSGEIYRNPKYSKQTCRVIIDAIKNSGYYALLKVYKADTLVSSVFIAPGKSVTIKLPVGAYKLKYGIGKTWFGQKEAFGDKDASYGILNEALIMTTGYYHKLTVSPGHDTGASYTNVGRSDF